MHVAITGASQGLGEALARELARAGADVTLVARRRDALEKLAAELPTRSFVVAQDLTDVERAAAWVPEAESALGPIDVLVSNAGLLTLGAAATFDGAEADRMMAINVLAPMRLVRAVLPGMLARKRGTIVNVTSMAAWVSLPGWLYQTASKTASAAFSEGLKRELEGTGVHVLTVYPGPTDTPMTRGGIDVYGKEALITKLPLGDPATFARRVRAAIERRSARIFYPRIYALARWFPRISGWLARAFAPRLPVKAV